MLVKDFLKKYPNDTFSMTTPGGYVNLTPEQAKELLNGHFIKGHLGNPDPEYAVLIRSDELLEQYVDSAIWKGNTCHMLTVCVESGVEPPEVKGMHEHDEELKLKEHVLK